MDAISSRAIWPFSKPTTSPSITAPSARAIRGESQLAGDCERAPIETEDVARLGQGD
jgi:hypothetical protein